MSKEKPHDFFISYKRTSGPEGNTARAEKLKQIISGRFHADCFLDVPDLWQEKFPEKIQSAIKESSGLIFVATKESLDFGAEKNYAALEWQWAREFRKPVFFYKFDAAPWPKLLTGINYFNLSNLFVADDDLKWIAQGEFKKAMAALGDALLPVTHQGRGAYQRLAEIYQTQNKVQQASELLDWANTNLEYPAARYVINNAQKLFQLSWQDAQSKEDYFRMNGENQTAKYLETESKLETLRADYDALKKSYQDLCGDVKQVDKSVDSVNRGVSGLSDKLDRNTDYRTRLEAVLETLSKRLPGVTLAKLDEQLHKLLKARRRLSFVTWVSAALAFVSVMATIVAYDQAYQMGWATDAKARMADILAVRPSN